MTGWQVADVARALAAPGRGLDLPGHGRAAILVPVLDAPEGPSLLFTVRASGLLRHAGQVSFPGDGSSPGRTSWRPPSARPRRRWD